MPPALDSGIMAGGASCTTSDHVSEGETSLTAVSFGVQATIKRETTSKAKIEMRFMGIFSFFRTICFS
jgi:hypothetical protein